MHNTTIAIKIEAVIIGVYSILKVFLYVDDFLAE